MLAAVFIANNLYALFFVQTDFKQEHIALCLKKAVWTVFNVREEDLPAQCALYWVLNRSFHDDILPVTELGSAGTSFTYQAEFNIFSVSQ